MNQKIVSQNLLFTLARKHLKFAYSGLTNETENFKKVTPSSSNEYDDIEGTFAWFSEKLKQGQEQVSGVDDLLGLIRQAHALTDLTRTWTLYEETWEQRFTPSRNEPPADRDFKRGAIRAGDTLVKRFYETVKGLTLDIPYRSIIVVPFMNRLHTGGFDSPMPYIVAPRWGYTQPWNWPAYAHEVGHHVYRNVEGLSDELKVYVANFLITQGYEYPLVSLWFNWLEELFADLFGILLLGPTFVETQQYILLLAVPRRAIISVENNEPRTVLLHSYDFTHPTPYVRGNLVLQMLELMGANEKNSLKQLQTQWQDFFSGLDTAQVTVNTHQFDANGKAIPIENQPEDTETLQKIGNQVLDLLLDSELNSLPDENGNPQSVKQFFSNLFAYGDNIPGNISEVRTDLFKAIEAFRQSSDDLAGQAQLKQLSEELVNNYSFGRAITDKG